MYITHINVYYTHTHTNKHVAYEAITGYALPHHHHHTVPVAMHTHMHLLTSVNGLAGIDKTPPVQVADGHHMSVSEAK